MVAPITRFIDAPSFRGQQVDHRTLPGEVQLFKSDPSGNGTIILSANPSTYIQQWKHWEAIYEEYRITEFSIELTPVQGSTFKGISSFWWDTGINQDPATLAQAFARTSRLVRNCSASSPNTRFTYKCREIEDLPYLETNSGTDFGTMRFVGFTDGAALDTPPSAFLFLVRPYYKIVFKTLRRLE